MISITPAVTVSVKDSGISADPNPVPYGGVQVACETGVLEQDVTLPADTSAEPLTFPVGVDTAAILIILPTTMTDLIVNLAAEELTVPVGQPLILYGVAAADLSVSSVLGGKLSYTVGA